MKNLANIQRQLQHGHIKLTRHALIRMVERNISLTEIQQAGTQATIIENYPDDKYSPSCLLLGFTQAGRPLHMLVSRWHTETVHITLYEPKADEWENHRIRR